MASMELNDDEKFDTMPIAEFKKPDFPYGLRITLTEKEFEKAGCDPSGLKAGDLIHLTQVFARVTDTHEHKSEGGDSCRVELQIENLDIEDEKTEG